MSKTNGVCAFCGITGEVTREHIPPKNLFPSPKPSNLITVPSCQACNAGYQKDEEYFRICIFSVIHSQKFEKLALELVSKQLTRRPKLATTVLNDFEDVPVDGIVLQGWRTGNPRVGRIIEKIVRGLFFKETGIRFPEDQKVVWNLMDKEFEGELGVGAEYALKNSPLHDFGNGVFRYAVTIGAARNSFWKLTFYDDINLFAVTMKPEGVTV